MCYNKKKKYELTQERNNWGFYRIRALRDIPRYGVKAGDLGGFVESEKNLSHGGDSWISGNAQVSGDAWVYGGAQVSGDAWVSGNAQVYGGALISGNAQVYGDAWVYGSSRVYGHAWVSGCSTIREFDEITETNQYMVIQGFKYPITITYCSIHIGCMDFTLDDLDKEFKGGDLSNKEIRQMKIMIEMALDIIIEKL